MDGTKERSAWARLGLRAGEGPVVLLGALFFYALLASYYLVRPLRDAYGAARPEELPYLFLGTFAVTVAVQPAFGALVSRFGRSTIAPATFRSLAVVTLVLGGLLVGLEGTAQRYAQYAFFCWSSVFSLTGVSLFWGLIGDLVGRRRSLRLFGPMAVGGTLGAMTGSAFVGFATALLPVLDDAPLAYAVLAAVLLEVCVRLSRAVERRALTLPADVEREEVPREERAKERTKPIGGGVLTGFKHVANSGFLSGIAVYVVLYVTASTLLYDFGARIMRDAFASDAVRTVFFARIDLLVNAATLLLQLGATRVVLERIGVGAALAAVPLVSAVGFAALGAEPTLFALALFQVLRRSAEYGLSKPGRDALFTVTSPEDRYKSKLVVDTVAYRGGDVAAIWGKTWLAKSGVLQSTVGYGLAVLSVGAVLLSLLLGRTYRRRAAEQRD